MSTDTTAASLSGTNLIDESLPIELVPAWPVPMVRVPAATSKPPNLPPDAQQVPTPDLPNFLLRVSPAQQLGRDVHRLAGVGPPAYSGSSSGPAEVGADPHVVDADQPDCVVDMIDEMPDRGECPVFVLLRQSGLELRTALWCELSCLAASPSSGRGFAESARSLCPSWESPT